MMPTFSLFGLLETASKNEPDGGGISTKSPVRGPQVQSNKTALSLTVRLTTCSPPHSKQHIAIARTN